MRVVNYLQIFQMFLVSAHLFAVPLTAGLMYSSHAVSAAKP